VSWAFLNSTKRHFNQGSCGSCWAIASAVLLEAHSEIHAAEGKGRTFSAQELVSCVPNPKHCGGTGGCEGATIELAMEWTIRHGLSDDVAAPYKGVDGECLAEKQGGGLSLLQIRDRSGVRSDAPTEENVAENEHDASVMPGSQFGMLGWERLPENDYSAMLHALQEGPVGISVAASDWFDYSHGVFDKCIKDSVIDHAVVLIGYGQTEDPAGDGYWLLKNSWGLEWGEHGSMRLMRKTGEEDEGGWCGVDRQPELGSGCVGGPSEVKVCGTCGILYDAVVPHWQGSAEHAKQRALAPGKY
jgi:cathepsin L